MKEGFKDDTKYFNDEKKKQILREAIKKIVAEETSDGKKGEEDENKDKNKNKKADNKE